MKFINEKGQNAIRNFRYKGGDLSISYNYVWSPLAELVLKVTPKTIAPNTITVFGFFIHVFFTIVLISQGSYRGPAPSWALLCYGISVFIYQTLDNVDGKQARAIKNSSPLGMIMDHGCDALGLVFLTLGMARILRLQDYDLILYVFTFGVTFGFYISAWCQYHSQGLMILGKVNAVDDGMPVIWMSAIYCSIFGQDMWLNTFKIFGQTYQLNTIIAVSIIFAGFIQIYSIIYQAGSHFTKNLGKAAFDLINLALIAFAIYVISAHSTLVKEYFFEVMVGLGFVMARTISTALVCSVSQMQLNQFHPSLLLFSLGYPAYVFLGKSLISSELLVYAITGFAIIQYTIFVCSVSIQIAQILDIKVFSVFAPKPVKNQ